MSNTKATRTRIAPRVYANREAVSAYLVERCETVTAFARRIGCSQAHASRMLSGDRAVGPKIRQRMMRVTGLDAAHLFEPAIPAKSRPLHPRAKPARGA